MASFHTHALTALPQGLFGNMPGSCMEATFMTRMGGHRQWATVGWGQPMKCLQASGIQFLLLVVLGSRAGSGGLLCSSQIYTRCPHLDGGLGGTWKPTRLDFPITLFFRTVLTFRKFENTEQKCAYSLYPFPYY